MTDSSPVHSPLPWRPLTRPDRAPADQPVVFLGSEGETGVIARDLDDFLWLLAGGLGPREAATSHTSGQVPHPHEQLTAVAERCAPGRRRPAADVARLAAHEFPDFEGTITELCR
ncbi:hypothetical protein [Streptomyces sp. NPDC055189]